MLGHSARLRRMRDSAWCKVRTLYAAHLGYFAPEYRRKRIPGPEGIGNVRIVLESELTDGTHVSYSPPALGEYRREYASDIL